MSFSIGAAGHEACQVAAANTFRPGIDWFYPYYRDMVLCTVFGMTTKEFMLNALNRQAIQFTRQTDADALRPRRATYCEPELPQLEPSICRL